MPPARSRAQALATLALSVLIATTACGTDDAANAEADRQAEIAEKGEGVMGFDLDATTHVFSPTDTGGVQDVVARDPNDQAEIAAIRTHLETEAGNFARGDFSASAAIHGDDMPGLAELQAAGNSLTIDYATLPDGARVTYTSDDPVVITALHEWFDAQLGDHGNDAEHG